jgi:hypothetical protein
MMINMTSSIAQIEFAVSNNIRQLATSKLEAQRGKMVPSEGVVSNFDSDQKQFLTKALEGLTLVQYHTHAGLAFQDGYDALPPGQTQPFRPLPGQSVLSYPIAAGSPAMSTNFIRGGKENLKRVYPTKYLTKARVTYTFGDTADPGIHIFYHPEETVVGDAGLYFDIGSRALWDENSPLPPGVRYIELQDMEWIVFTQFGLPLPGTRLSDAAEPDIFATIPSGEKPPDLYTIILPRNHEGDIKHNVVPLPGGAWSHLPEVYADYSYWTGEVTDPVSWAGIDDYWKYRGITPALVQTFLDNHPAAALG